MSATRTPIVFLNHIHLSFHLGDGGTDIAAGNLGDLFAWLETLESWRHSAIVARLALLN